ncbi:Uncharacterised protein [Avibacterium paragallinarum]|uniref:Uncharacterized protein n=1 Tax=Avibacterium paragallinarum TaxID=728 RepID=A0A377I4R1_AVIPA|nr:hypothetical protein C3364_05570 [Avibacterium paragallinarum]STO70151.1 Uncharacterised protein [Avibacterium paragallinarum]
MEKLNVKTHHQQTHSYADNNRCLLTFSHGRYEFADLAVYPVLALDLLQVQARRVDRLVGIGATDLTSPLNGEDETQNPQAEIISVQALIGKVAECYFQKADPLASLQGNSCKNIPTSSSRCRGEYPVAFFPLVSVVGSLGLPLQGEISPYRHIALFVPLLDALNVKTTNVIVELLQLLILTEAAQRFQVIKKPRRQELLVRLRGIIEFYVDQLG